MLNRAEEIYKRALMFIKTRTIIAGLILVGLLILMAGAFFVFSMRRPQTPKPAASKTPTASPERSNMTRYSAPTITPTPTLLPRKLQYGILKDITQPRITGTVRHLDEDLKLAASQDSGFKVDYYEAGTYVSGPYSGYTRIIMIIQNAFMGPPTTKVFLTQDRKKYVLVGSPAAAKAYESDNWNSPLAGVNPAVVEKTDDPDSDLPDVLQLDGTFALYKRGVLTVADKARADNQNDPPPYKLADDFSSYRSLPPQGSFLTLYAVPSTPIGGWVEQPYAQQDIAAQKEYLKETAGVVVKDRTGVAYTYNLARTSNILAHPELTVEHPEVSTHFASLFMSVKGSELGESQGYYSQYDVAVPKNCATTPDTYIVSGISDDEFVTVGKTADNVELYRLKDAANPLYRLQYDSKPGYAYDGKTKEIYSLVEKNTVVYPTYDTYVARTPLLFFRDPWNRWVALGEFDYALPGGCGKPVVYLYPPKPKDVRVRFSQPVQFTSDIPAYHAGWSVRAYPDGVLTDLQPQYTDCSAIDTDKPGSEYAGAACRQNKYPYLYWAGETIGNPYPAISTGWYVKHGDLSRIFDEKLTQAGLNKRERRDMEEYWLPRMQQENASYYRLSLLTASELNNIIPMEVNPHPDTVIRVFLDYAPLRALPDKPITAPELAPPVRTGFTVVEWGGLKR